MKKTLSVVLAVVLAISMFASFAYVATPEKSTDHQLSLVSAKAVNVQDTAQGVRSYSDLVDTTRIFQVNEVIFLAVTAEVKNLEKYPSLKSIEDKDIKVIVGSPSIDLSYAKLSSPTLLANVWSGVSAVDVATIGYVAPAGSMLTYNKNANEVEWTFHGVSMYGMAGSGHNTASMHLVTFDPEFKGDKINIPAIKLRDKETSWVLGGQTFDAKYSAPDAIGYTMVVTGVTKDNEGAQQGTFYAKILISSAEKFESVGSYYLVGPSGEYLNSISESSIKSLKSYDEKIKKWDTYLEWRDYVKIQVHKLEISGGYTVFKYYIPSSAVMNYTDFFYNGDATAVNNGNSGTAEFADYGLTIGRANPNLFDNATKFSNKMGEDFLEVAGGVRSVKAYENYTSSKQIDVPITSVVYTNNKAYYAPGFYGGTIKWGLGGYGVGGGTEWIAESTGYESRTESTQSKEVVEYFELHLKDEQRKVYDARNIRIVAPSLGAEYAGVSSDKIRVDSTGNIGQNYGSLDLFGNTDEMFYGILYRELDWVPLGGTGTVTPPIIQKDFEIYNPDTGKWMRTALNAAGTAYEDPSALATARAEYADWYTQAQIVEVLKTNGQTGYMYDNWTKDDSAGPLTSNATITTAKFLFDGEVTAATASPSLTGSYLAGTGLVAGIPTIEDAKLLSKEVVETDIDGVKASEILYHGDNTTNPILNGAGGSNSETHYMNGPIKTLGVTDIFEDPAYGNYLDTVKVGDNDWVVKLYIDSAKVKSLFGVDYLSELTSTSAGPGAVYVYYHDNIDHFSSTDRDKVIASTTPVDRFTRPDTMRVGLSSTGNFTPGIAAAANTYHNNGQFIVPMMPQVDAQRVGFNSPLYYSRLTMGKGTKDVSVATDGISFNNLVNEWKDSTIIDSNLKGADQLATFKTYLKFEWSNYTGTLSIPVHAYTEYDSISDLPKPNSTQLGVPVGGEIWPGLTLGTAGAKADQAYIIAFYGKDVEIKNGKPIITLSNFVVWDPIAQKWNPVKTTGNIINASAYKSGNVLPGINLADEKGYDTGLKLASLVSGFDFYKDPSKAADDYYYYYDSSTAAPTRYWEGGADDIVVDHNGIVMYSIQTYEDEVPVISIATERTYFASDDGYGICLFDGTSNAYGSQFAGRRVYRSNDSNLAYSVLGTHVQDSARKITALKYFDLDTSFNTVWKVLDSAFESKGAAAVYSENVEGTFNYGTISIVPDDLDESTEENEVELTDDGETDAPVVDDNTTEPDDEIIEDETTPAPDVVEDEPTAKPATPPTTTTTVPRTADVNANVAVALIAAAIVAAAGLAFVMKKTR